MNKKRRTCFLFVLAGLVAGSLMISPAAKASNTTGEDSKEVSQLLSEMKLEAHQLELDAVEMETFSRSRLSETSHATKLNMIGEHINKAGELLSKLHDARDRGSAWQQKAIDEIYPLLKELAENTETAMKLFNENKPRADMSPNYKEYLKENRGMASELAALITDYVDYGFHKSHFERLGEKVVASER
jgi:glycerophosphoryl diester phosphodiesterase